MVRFPVCKSCPTVVLPLREVRSVCVVVLHWTLVMTLWSYWTAFLWNREASAVMTGISLASSTRTILKVWPFWKMLLRLPFMVRVHPTGLFWLLPRKEVRINWRLHSVRPTLYKPVPNWQICWVTMNLSIPSKAKEPMHNGRYSARHIRTGTMRFIKMPSVRIII